MYYQKKPNCQKKIRFIPLERSPAVGKKRCFREFDSPSVETRFPTPIHPSLKDPGKFKKPNLENHQKPKKKKRILISRPQKKQNIFDFATSNVKIKTLHAKKSYVKQKEFELSEYAEREPREKKKQMGPSQSEKRAREMERQRAMAIKQRQYNERMVKDVIISKFKRKIEALELPDLQNGVKKMNFRISLHPGPKTGIMTPEQKGSFKKSMKEKQRRFLKKREMQRIETQWEISEIKSCFLAVQRLVGKLRPFKRKKTHPNPKKEDSGQKEALDVQENPKFEWIKHINIYK